MDRYRIPRLLTEAAMVVAVAVAMVVAAEGQSTPACAEKLTACAEYLNSTKPPASCCNPLRQTLMTERTCLCNLYNTPGLLPSLGINVSQAILLPHYCNIPGGTDACNKSSASPPKASTSSLPPPAQPAAKESSQAGGRLAGAGVFTSLLWWACMMLQ